MCIFLPCCLRARGAARAYYLPIEGQLRPFCSKAWPKSIALLLSSQQRAALFRRRCHTRVILHHSTPCRPTLTRRVTSDGHLSSSSCGFSDSARATPAEAARRAESAASRAASAGDNTRTPRNSSAPHAASLPSRRCASTIATSSLASLWFSSRCALIAPSPNDGGNGRHASLITMGSSARATGDCKLTASWSAPRAVASVDNRAYTSRSSGAFAWRAASNDVSLPAGARQRVGGSGTAATFAPPDPANARQATAMVSARARGGGTSSQRCKKRADAAGHDLVTAAPAPATVTSDGTKGATPPMAAACDVGSKPSCAAVATCRGRGCHRRSLCAPVQCSWGRAFGSGRSMTVLSRVRCHGAIGHLIVVIAVPVLPSVLTSAGTRHATEATHNTRASTAAANVAPCYHRDRARPCGRHGTGRDNAVGKPCKTTAWPLLREPPTSKRGCARPRLHLPH